MGNKMNAVAPKSYIDNCLKFDRILDGDNQVYVGIGSLGLGKSSQVIRLGDFTNEYYRLHDYQEEENKLIYEFEKDVKMVLEKKDGYFIMQIAKTIDPVIVKYFTPIHLSETSYELDRIHYLFTKE